MHRPSQSRPTQTLSLLARWLPLAGAFVLGACAATAVTSRAANPESATQELPTGSGEAMVRGLDDAPRRAAPSGTATVTVLAHGTQAFVAKLEMEPGAKVPSHRDATEETIHILEGSGSVTMDGTTYSVGPGTTIFMPAQAEVSFENADAPLVGIQVFAGPGPAAKYDAWTALD